MVSMRLLMNSLRKRKLLVAIQVVVLFLIFSHSFGTDYLIPYNSNTEYASSAARVQPMQLPDPVAKRTLIGNVLRAALDAKPSPFKLDRDALKTSSCPKKGDVSSGGIDQFHWTSAKNLKACLNLDDYAIKTLSEAHSRYMKTLFNDKGEFAISKSDFKKLYPNEKGIVTLGGGRYTILAMLMIETVRRHGSTLPVEVMFPPEDEGEFDFCNNWLPKHNGRCVMMSQEVPFEILQKDKEVRFKSYQIKSLALLLTSFKQFVFIDADNNAMKNIDHIFDTEAFKTHGLILWPDLWKRFTNPGFYDIAGVKYDLGKRVRNVNDDASPPETYDPNHSIYTTHDLKQREEIAKHLYEDVSLADLDGTIADTTTESGQMMVDNKKHLSTLLLALYYNIYGPDLYYYMMSMGTAGEGDKETFISAAHVLHLPYYQVKTNIGFDGYVNDVDNQFKGVGLMQTDFEQDYQRHKQVLKELATEKPLEPVKYQLPNHFQDKMKNPDGTSLDIMFLHASFHKFDPADLAKSKQYFKQNGEQVRGYNRIDAYKNFDFELFSFKKLYDNLCTSDHISFKSLKKHEGTEFWTSMCSYFKQRVDFLTKTKPANAFI